jgi:hypothetical protein
MRVWWYDRRAFPLGPMEPQIYQTSPPELVVNPSNEQLTLTYALAVAAAVDGKRGPFDPEDAERAQLAGLRAVLARWGRPKPPSLKDQALDALGPEPRPETGFTGDTILNHGTIERHRLIRKALEQLND